MLIMAMATANPIIDDDKFINRRSIAEPEKLDMFSKQIEISLK